MRSLFQVLLQITLLGSTFLLAIGQQAEHCNPSVCRLPDCNCGGEAIPGGYRHEEIPQFVLLTFDDAVNDLNEKFFSDLFKERYNPNGCPIKVI